MCVCLCALQRVRLALAEALRLYPEPPILIRRALEEDVLPQGGSDVEGQSATHSLS
jgi:cytochrome P450